MALRSTVPAPTCSNGARVHKFLLQPSTSSRPHAILPPVGPAFPIIQQGSAPPAIHTYWCALVEIIPHLLRHAHILLPGAPHIEIKMSSGRRLSCIVMGSDTYSHYIACMMALNGANVHIFTGEDPPRSIGFPYFESALDVLPFTWNSADMFSETVPGAMRSWLRMHKEELRTVEAPRIARLTTPLSEEETRTLGGLLQYILGKYRPGTSVYQLVQMFRTYTSRSVSVRWRAVITPLYTAALALQMDIHALHLRPYFVKRLINSVQTGMELDLTVPFTVPKKPDDPEGMLSECELGVKKLKLWTASEPHVELQHRTYISTRSLNDVLLKHHRITLHEEILVAFNIEPSADPKGSVTVKFTPRGGKERVLVADHIITEGISATYAVKKQLARNDVERDVLMTAAEHVLKSVQHWSTVFVQQMGVLKPECRPEGKDRVVYDAKTDTLLIRLPQKTKEEALVSILPGFYKSHDVHDEGRKHHITIFPAGILSAPSEHRYYDAHHGAHVHLPYDIQVHTAHPDSRGAMAAIRLVFNVNSASKHTGVDKYAADCMTEEVEKNQGRRLQNMARYVDYLFSRRWRHFLVGDQ